MSKITRPDIHQTLAVLSTKVKEPDENDWQKLARIINFLNGTKEKYLNLSAEDLKVVKWYVDASFTVQPDFKIRTKMIMTM